MNSIEYSIVESWEWWDDAGTMSIILYNVTLKEGVLKQMEQRKWPSIQIDGENSKLYLFDENGNAVHEFSLCLNVL